MCNYADDIKTPVRGADLGGDVAGPQPSTAGSSIDPATSGVAAHSGPDMWTPVTIFYTPNSEANTPAGVREDIAVTLFLSKAGIGHKRIFFVMPGEPARIMHLIRTADIDRMRDAFRAEDAFSDAIGTPDENEVFSLMFDVSAADYRGGGQSRRKIAVYPPNDNFATPRVADDRQYLVQRNVEWTAKTQPSYFIDMSEGNPAIAFAILSDEETRNG